MPQIRKLPLGVEKQGCLAQIRRLRHTIRKTGRADPLKICTKGKIVAARPYRPRRRKEPCPNRHGISNPEDGLFRHADPDTVRKRCLREAAGQIRDVPDCDRQAWPPLRNLSIYDSAGHGEWSSLSGAAVHLRSWCANPQRTARRSWRTSWRQTKTDGIGRYALRTNRAHAANRNDTTKNAGSSW